MKIQTTILNKVIESFMKFCSKLFNHSETDNEQDNIRLIIYVVVIFVLIFIIYFFYRYFKELNPATNLKVKFINHIEELNMEVYKLQWLQSPDDFADYQEVIYTIDGTEMKNRCEMDESELSIQCPTDSGVIVFVRTYHIDPSKAYADSDILVFNAKNEAQLRPASNLSANWIQHIPD
jgi:hypothetical protein